MSADTAPPRSQRDEIFALAQEYARSAVDYVARSAPDTKEATRQARIRLHAGIAVVCDELDKLKGKSPEGPAGPVDVLLSVLRMTPSLENRAIVLQSYIAEFGPIPDEFGDKVRQFLKPKP